MHISWKFRIKYIISVDFFLERVKLQCVCICSSDKFADCQTNNIAVPGQAVALLA